MDYVASLPVQNNGFRGAVQLEKGTYHVHGRLVIKASGVVLRGSGMGENGTRLIAEGKDRQTFIRVLGENNIQLEESSDIMNNYVPVNSNRVLVFTSKQFKIGQHILVNRPSTKKWIDELVMAEFGGEETSYIGWKPGQRDLHWDRTITAIHGDTLIFDAPLTTSLDKTLEPAV